MNTDETANITAAEDDGKQVKWFFMCDQKRRNALDPAYKMLDARGFEVFTPMVKKIVGTGKSKRVVEVPLLSDILFVYSTEEKLDPIIEKTPTLHYRFKKGGKYREHIIVSDDDMDSFKHAVENAEIKEFYAIEDLPKELIGNKVTIHGGPLDGYSVTLKKMQGSKKKRIFVELPRLAYAELELTEFDSMTVEKD